MTLISKTLGSQMLMTATLGLLMAQAIPLTGKEKRFLPLQRVFGSIPSFSKLVTLSSLPSTQLSQEEHLLVSFWLQLLFAAISLIEIGKPLEERVLKLDEALREWAQV